MSQCNQDSHHCDECGSEMVLVDAPVRGFHIWRIEFSWWGKLPYCAECAFERDQEPERDAYNAGIEDGWEQAYRDMPLREFEL